MQNNLKIGFFTFSDGTQEFRDAGARLAKQAKDLRLFEKVVFLTDQDLRRIDLSWKTTALDLELLNMIPYYYLGTKAWLIRLALSGYFGNFDLIFYADAGCELVENRVTKKKYKKLFSLAMQHGGVAEQLNYPEKTYTKKYLVRYFDLSINEMESGQVQATWSIWKNSTASKNMADQWVSLSNPFLNLWHDPDGIEIRQQDSSFIEHRRDQSIFSVIWKRNKYFLKSPYWEYGGKLGKLRGRAIPIHTIRNRSGISTLPRNSKNYLLASLGNFINNSSEFIRKFSNN